MFLGRMECYLFPLKSENSSVLFPGPLTAVGLCTNHHLLQTDACLMSVERYTIYGYNDKLIKTLFNTMFA